MFDLSIVLERVASAWCYSKWHIYLFEIIMMAYATDRLIAEVAKKLVTYDLGLNVFPRTTTSVLKGVAT